MNTITLTVLCACMILGVALADFGSYGGGYGGGYSSGYGGGYGGGSSGGYGYGQYSYVPVPFGGAGGAGGAGGLGNGGLLALIGFLFIFVLLFSNNSLFNTTSSATPVTIVQG